MSPAKKAAGPPTRDRSGYYKLPDGTKCLSVTTIIGQGVPKDLVGWATWEVAKAAVDSIPKLSRLRGTTARNEMVTYLKGAANRVRDAAATLGSAIHDVAEAKVLGQPVAEPTDEQRPFVQAFQNFLDDHTPVFHATELVVAHPEHGWAGRTDAHAELPLLGDGVFVLDYKTGRNPYPEACLQLSCYQRAPVGWLNDGTEVEPPKAVAAYVVHIRPEKYDRGYAIYPADTGDDVYEFFLAAQQVATWCKARSGSALGAPVEVPAVAEEVA